MDKPLLDALFSMPWGMCSEMGLLDGMVILNFTFGELPDCFAQHLLPFRIPPIVYNGSTRVQISPPHSPTLVISDTVSTAAILMAQGDGSLWF